MKRLIIFAALFIGNGTVHAQKPMDIGRTAVTVQALDRPATEILKDLEQQIGYKFSYDADQLKKSNISLASDSLSLLEVIDSLFVIKKPKLRKIGLQLVVYKPSGTKLASSTCFNVIESRLLDELTGLPVANASIIALRSEQMTVSNTDGVFRLTVPCEIETVRLEIKAIGYQSQLIEEPLRLLQNVIEMSGDYITLQEVVIHSVPAEILIREVIDKIPDNFMDRPSNATAFFRDAVLKNGKLIKMSEAVLDVYNESYISVNHGDKTQLIKGRKFVAPRPKDTLEFKIKGTLQTCIELDVVKNLPAFFSTESYKRFEYNFVDIVVYNGREIYVVDFMKKPKDLGLPFQGQMFIDKERMALIAIDFELKKSEMRGSKFNFVLKNPIGTKTYLQSARYHVSYGEVEGKLVMNYVRITTTFKVKNKKSLFSANFSTLSEFVVNQFVTDKVKKISAKETHMAQRVFMDEPMVYDENYWHGINFLPIDKSLTEATEELQELLKKLIK